MRAFAILVGLFPALIGTPAGAAGEKLPADVPGSHWAAASVQEVTRNGVLDLPDGRHFRGESKATRAQAVIALAKLARLLQAGTWHGGGSVPVSAKTAAAIQENDGWQSQPLTRYSLAVALARTGDYVANGMHRDTGAKDLAQSIVFPAKPKVTVSRANPAHSALVYLVNNNMIWPGSPLLKADSTPIRGAEMSRALAQMVTGLNNRLTSLGHDENGETPDKTFHPKRPAPKP